MAAERVRAYVGLGANLGDAPHTLAAAVNTLHALPGVALHGVSRLYVTRPVGVTDQPDFHNAVVALDVPAGPDPETGALALLVALKAIEKAFGRQERRRWGPRELDLDLLVFGTHRINIDPAGVASRAGVPDPGDGTWLQVPHPSARDRLFVLAPLAELAPDLVPPGWERSVAAACTERVTIDGDQVARPVGTWQGRGWDLSP
ncbi:MAG: 2-amino-4-hydroxy-6-hydroxymethyldihydropteridine diphosphokinase [Chloroflexota bacterium]|jgi:2-amino-4-hydroxy-6-hydroxymethyldihydropteridine diphosphokinase|nr:2-amino-4-hydroxy-6-hydroxymethyldihydropteridine diphosphokinase [Chloroflexota bacterium]